MAATAGVGTIQSKEPGASFRAPFLASRNPQVALLALQVIFFLWINYCATQYSSLNTNHLALTMSLWEILWTEMILSCWKWFVYVCYPWECWWPSERCLHILLACCQFTLRRNFLPAILCCNCLGYPRWPLGTWLLGPSSHATLAAFYSPQQITAPCDSQREVGKCTLLQWEKLKARLKNDHKKKENNYILFGNILPQKPSAR